jgi:hypothetical protein
VRYEELRRHVLVRRSTNGRLGLTLLIRQGVAAWSEAQLASPSRCARVLESPSDALVPEESRADIVHVLANMTLSNLKEVRA